MATRMNKEVRVDGLTKEVARLRKALHDISVVGLLSEEKDSPRSARMREIAEKALKEKA